MALYSGEFDLKPAFYHFCKFLFNPDFSLGLEMTTQDSLMDFLGKFEGNSHSIDRKFAQTKTQNGQVGIQVD